MEATPRKREERTGCQETQDVHPLPLKVCVEVPAELAWRSLWAGSWRELEEEEEEEEG